MPITVTEFDWATGMPTGIRYLIGGGDIQSVVREMHQRISNSEIRGAGTQIKSGDVGYAFEY